MDWVERWQMDRCIFVYVGGFGLPELNRLIFTVGWEYSFDLTCVNDGINNISNVWTDFFY